MVPCRFVLRRLWRHGGSSIRMLRIVGVAVYILCAVTVPSFFLEGKEEPGACCEGDEEGHA